MSVSRVSDPLPIESIKELGTGSYGCVYLVRVLTTRKLYAMKLLNLSPLSKNQRVLIQKEIEIMSNLRHNNVIRFKQAFLANNSEIHIIMEYADLGDLSQAVKNLSPTNTDLQGKCLNISEYYVLYFVGAFTVRLEQQVPSSRQAQFFKPKFRRRFYVGGKLF